MSEPVYAVVCTQITHVPGDERSRTNPGHGYPEHNVQHEVFKEFDSKEEWEKWIEDAENPQFGQKKQYRAFVCIPAEVETTVHINITADKER